MLNEGLRKLILANESADAGAIVHEEDHVWNHASKYPYGTNREQDGLDTESLVGQATEGGDEREDEEDEAEEGDEEVADGCDDAYIGNV